MKMKTMTRKATTTALLLAPLFVLAGCGGDTESAGDGADTASDNPLYRPAALVETAPETFQARFETTKGEFVVEVTRAWAPNGADRFYNLVKNGYYDDVRFFRVIENFMAQFGMHGDPQVQVRWARATISADPVMTSNTRGTITFAMADPGHAHHPDLHQLHRQLAPRRDGLRPLRRRRRGHGCRRSDLLGVRRARSARQRPHHRRTSRQGATSTSTRTSRRWTTSSRLRWWVRREGSTLGSIRHADRPA